jgi:uncharacterized protein YcsI (UPF0317 family)
MPIESLEIDPCRDATRHRAYKDGMLVGGETTGIVSEWQDNNLGIVSEWQDNNLGILIGCSYGLESALDVAGLTPRHVAQNRNMPMYRTRISLCH